MLTGFVAERFEEPAPHDLVALVAAGRLPCLGKPVRDVRQPSQCFPTGSAADLQAGHAEVLIVGVGLL